MGQVDATISLLANNASFGVQPARVARLFLYGLVSLSRLVSTLFGVFLSTKFYTCTVYTLFISPAAYTHLESANWEAWSYPPTLRMIYTWATLPVFLVVALVYTVTELLLLWPATQCVEQKLPPLVNYLFCRSAEARLQSGERTKENQRYFAHQCKKVAFHLLFCIGAFFPLLEAGQSFAGANSFLSHFNENHSVVQGIAWGVAVAAMLVTFVFYTQSFYNTLYTRYTEERATSFGKANVSSDALVYDLGAPEVLNDFDNTRSVASEVEIENVNKKESGLCVKIELAMYLILTSCYYRFFIKSSVLALGVRDIFSPYQLIPQVVAVVIALVNNYHVIGAAHTGNVCRRLKQFTYKPLNRIVTTHAGFLSLILLETFSAYTMVFSISLFAALNDFANVLFDQPSLFLQQVLFVAAHLAGIFTIRPNLSFVAISSFLPTIYAVRPGVWRHWRRIFSVNYGERLNGLLQERANKNQGASQLELPGNPRGGKR